MQSVHAASTTNSEWGGGGGGGWAKPPSALPSTTNLYSYTIIKLFLQLFHEGYILGLGID